VRSLPWPNPYEDGPTDELYVPYFENRLMLKVSAAGYDFLMSVVAAYVNGEITESAALSAELIFFTNSWLEADINPVDRKDLRSFWSTVFRVTRNVG